MCSRILRGRAGAGLGTHLLPQSACHLVIFTAVLFFYRADESVRACNPRFFGSHLEGLLSTPAAKGENLKDCNDVGVFLPYMQRKVEA